MKITYYLALTVSVLVVLGISYLVTPLSSVVEFNPLTSAANYLAVMADHSPLTASLVHILSKLGCLSSTILI